MAKEPTLVILKPDAMQKNLVGNILTKLTEAKLDLIAAKVVKVSRELAEEHYRDLKGKPFFAELLDYITGVFHGQNKVLVLVYYGEDAIARIRELGGATNPEDGDPTSIRGMYGRIKTDGKFENVIHASSDPAEAEREIKLWFRPDELYMELYPEK